MSLIDKTFVFEEWFSWSKGITLPVVYQEPTFANGYSTSARTWLHPLTIGDFNNDNFVDVVVSTVDAKSLPYILISNGVGGFSMAASFDGDAARFFIRNGTTADLNQDGWLDFVGFESTHLMKGQRDLILINNKGEGFKVSPSPLAETEGHHGGAVGDLNGDGLIDVFGVREAGWTNYSGVDTRAPLLQQPDGSFKLDLNALPKSFDPYASGASASADLNNDGLDDIVFALTAMAKDPFGVRVGGEQLTFSLLEQTPILAIGLAERGVPISNWSFQFIGRHWADKKTYDEFVTKYGQPNSSATAGANSLAVLDINFDGKKDIVVGSYLSEGFLQRAGGFQVFVNDGKSFTDQTQTYFPNQDANRDLESRFNFNYFLNDLNGDGLKDFLVTGGAAVPWPHLSKYGSYGSIFINSGSGFLPASADQMRVFDNSVVGAYGIYDFMPADLNGDGATDLVSLRNERDFDWGTPGAQDRTGYVVVSHLNLAIEKDSRTPMTVLGTPTNDLMKSTDERPYLRGMAGDDMLQGRKGHVDTAIYYGARKDFEIRQDGTDWVLKDLFGNEGTDRLVDIERISFSGSTLAINQGAEAVPSVAYRLYRAAFNRDPDLAGLGYWIDVLTKTYNPELAPDQNQVLLDSARDFVGSAEFKSIYGDTVSNATYVLNLYKNTLGRDPLAINPQTGKAFDAPGYEYWLSVLDQGYTSRQHMFVFFSESAENKAAVAPIIATGVEYVPFVPPGT